MANDLAFLNGKLATQLRDTSGTLVWASTEKDDLITWAVASLWPRFSRPLNLTSATIALITGTYVYNLPTGVVAVSRVDVIDSTSTPSGTIPGASWEIVGDPILGTGQLHISPVFAITGYTAQLTGYGMYGVATNLIPDILIPLVLAKARSEAYRRSAGSRVQFANWLAKNQTQNVSVNELVELQNEADNEIQRLMRELPRTWQKPVQGRVG